MRFITTTFAAAIDRVNSEHNAYQDTTKGMLKANRACQGGGMKMFDTFISHSHQIESRRGIS